VYATACPNSKCSCEVHTNTTEDKPYSIDFELEKDKSGSAKVNNLQPDTHYQFSVICKGNIANTGYNLNIKTDYGAPSPPQNMVVTLVEKHLQITWLPPAKPAGPINNYEIKIDNETAKNDIPRNETSYQIPKEYVLGTKHKISLRACNNDTRSRFVCSDPIEKEGIYDPITPTPVPTTTTAKSKGVHYYSISISIIIFSLFLFTEMNW
jgi:hypothetical protein